MLDVLVGDPGSLSGDPRLPVRRVRPAPLVLRVMEWGLGPCPCMLSSARGFLGVTRACAVRWPRGFMVAKLKLKGFVYVRWELGRTVSRGVAKWRGSGFYSSLLKYSGSR